MPYTPPATLTDKPSTLNMTRYIALLSLLLLARLALAQNVAPRLQDIALTPGRALQFTLQNGLFDTTQTVSARLTYSAGGRPLPVQPIALRSGRDIQVYLSPAQSLSLPAVSYLQIIVGGQPAYVGNVVTSLLGRPGTPGSAIVVNYVVSGSGSGASLNPLEAHIQQYKLSGVQPGYTITHNQNTLLVSGTAFWTDTRQADPLWRVVIDTPNTVKLTGPPGEQFFGTVVLEPFPTSN